MLSPVLVLVLSEAVLVIDRGAAGPSCPRGFEYEHEYEHEHEHEREREREQERGGSVDAQLGHDERPHLLVRRGDLLRVASREAVLGVVNRQQRDRDTLFAQAKCHQL